jgi:hypothetical protein
MTNTTLRVLSYNIYWGGHQQSLERNIEVIRDSGIEGISGGENNWLFNYNFSRFYEA